MVGTAFQRMILCFSINSSTSAGSKRPRGSTRVSPTMTARMTVVMPPMWNSGPVMRVTSCAARSIWCGSFLVTCAVICRRASGARCGSTTALGWPEVPEVNMMKAGSPSSPEVSTSVRSAPWPELSMSQGPVGYCAGTLSAVRASASVRTGPIRASPLAISVALHQALASTGTAPAAKQAQTLAIHSGLFQPRMKTRSPRFTPSLIRAAALAAMALCMSPKVRVCSPCTT